MSGRRTSINGDAGFDGFIGLLVPGLEPDKPCYQVRRLQEACGTS